MNRRFSRTAFIWNWNIINGFIVTFNASLGNKSIKGLVQFQNKKNPDNLLTPVSSKMFMCFFL